MAKCLYLDEIIDLKCFKQEGSEDEAPKKALLCSNNETIKIMDLELGTVC